MLKPDLVPTPLIPETEKPAPRVGPLHRPSRTRGMVLTLRVLRWMWSMAWLTITNRATPEMAGRRTREVFEDLGGLWVKAGQFIAMRTDIFPLAFCWELSKLHDRATGFPNDVALRTIEGELGPIEELFEFVSDRPIAAASIGQIYRARLRREQVDVAIKVQRPYIGAIVARDMKHVARLARLLNWLLPVGRWNEFVWELSNTMTEELDYRIETEHLAKMRSSLKPHGVYVPKVFRRYCTQRVLVMEYIGGVSMADYVKMLQTDIDRLLEWLALNEIDPIKVGKRLYLSFARQVDENLFHGDLHPGNILLLKKNRIALIDFGSVGTMEAEMHLRNRMLNQAIARKEYSKVADLLLIMMPQLPAIDLEPVRQDLVRVMRLWEVRAQTRRMPYHEKSIASAMTELTRVAVRYRIPGSWSLLRLNRGAATLDMSLAFLAPEANYLKLLSTYFEESAARDVRHALDPRTMSMRMSGMARSMDEVQEQFAHMMHFQGAEFRRRAQTFEAQTSKVAYLLEIVSTNALYALNSVLILATLGYAYQHQRSWVAGLVAADLAAALDGLPQLPTTTWAVVWLVMGHLSLTTWRLRKRFGQKGAEREARGT